MPHHTFLHRLALGSHLLLLLLMGSWYGWLAPADYSLWLALSLWVAPLLLPLPGLLRGNPYSFAWSSLVLCLLLCHALTVLTISPSLRLLAAAELLLIMVAMIAGSLYARREGRRLGLGIRKKNTGKPDNGEQYGH